MSQIQKKNNLILNKILKKDKSLIDLANKLKKITKKLEIGYFKKFTKT